MRCTLLLGVSLLSSSLFACAFGPRVRTSYEGSSQALLLPPVVVYQGSTGALSYQSPALRDGQRLVPTKRVKGRACQRGIQVPVGAVVAAVTRYDLAPLWLSTGWGEGAYRDAVADARLRAKLPVDALLYDVRADLNVKVILGVYREQCLLLDAGVLVPVSAPVNESAPAAAPTDPEPVAP